MKNLMHSIALLIIVSFMISCGTNETSDHTGVSTKAPQSITISGSVISLKNGKDGYTAKIHTDKDGDYMALVSIVNLGGPKNFKRFKPSDKVSVSGIPSEMNGVKHLKVDKIIKVENRRTELIIAEDSFRGIKVGDKIDRHSNYAEKGQIKNGEGTFEVYKIKDYNNNPAGYFMADPKDKTLVGDITIQTMMAATKEGVKIGDTFTTLTQKIPNVEVHGSEVEGRTYANYKNLSYRLNVPNFTYDVDVAKIPATAKVLEIMIHRNNK